MESDLVDALEAAVEGTCSSMTLDWQDGACVCVVAASFGYPEKPQLGKEIVVDKEQAEKDGVLIFHAGTRLGGGESCDCRRARSGCSQCREVCGGSWLPARIEAFPTSVLKECGLARYRAAGRIIPGPSPVTIQPRLPGLGSSQPDLP